MRFVTLSSIVLLTVTLAASVGFVKAEGLTRAVRIIGPDAKPQPEGAPATTAPAQLPNSPQLTNNADLKLEILPGVDALVGTKMSFRVGAKKKGYLILVDVDAAGKLTQIFPNFQSLALADGHSLEGNQLPAGKQVTIPQVGSKTYEFVAAPPRGVGMTMAIFSETPLEMVDLPDVPSELAGKAEAAQFVRDAANGLRVVAADSSGGGQEPKFSFDARFYAIR
jgi:hypothetical protein